MPETSAASQVTADEMSSPSVPDGALMDVRSEILRQISCALNSEAEDGNFAKWVSHTKIPGGVDGST